MGTFKISTDQLDDFAATIPQELPGRPSGWSGLPLVSGRIKGYEHLTEFSTPRRRAITVTKMLRTSAVLSMAEEYLTGRVTAVKFHVARGAGVSDEAADALELWLGLGPYEDSGGHCVEGGTSETLIRHMMSARIYGHCAMSESYHYDEGDHGLYMVKLHRRRQESYESYVTAGGGDRLVGIAQRIGYTGSIRAVTKFLPINETLWLVHRPDLGHWDGRSIFRSIYANWRSQALRYRQDDLAANHWASPPLQATLDVASFSALANGADGAPVTREDFTSEISSLTDKLTALSVDDSSHIVLPSWWKLEPVTNVAGSYEPSKILASVSHHERVMAERLFLAFMQQGRSGSGGSYSMVQTQQTLVEDSVVDQAQWIVNALNHQTVRRFLKVNFSRLPEGEYPRLTFERASIKIPFWQRDPQAFASFVAAGVLTPSEEDERAIRAASDLPPPPEDSPSALDRQALKAGDRLAVPAGQREAANPGKSKKTKNAFVNRLIEREE